MPFRSQRHLDEVNYRSDQRASAILGTDSFATHGIPLRPDPNTGKLVTWEPEFGPTLISLQGLVGAQQKIQAIPNFRLFPNITRDFSYVSATLKAPEGYTARLRYDYFKEPVCKRGKKPDSFRRVSGPKIGFKSFEKSMTRQEYEAAVNAGLTVQSGLINLRKHFASTLPDAIAGLQKGGIHMTGLMCVERAGFEGTHLLRDGKHKFLINYAGSYDVGTCHDIRLIGQDSIIANHFETELEATGVRGNVKLSDNELIKVIQASMDDVEPHVTRSFAEHSIANDDPRFTMGKNTRAEYEQSRFATPEELAALNMQPSFLITPEGIVSLSDIFDGKGTPLISPQEIHQIAEMGIIESRHLIEALDRQVA